MHESLAVILAYTAEPDPLSGLRQYIHPDVAGAHISSSAQHVLGLGRSADGSVVLRAAIA